MRRLLFLLLLVCSLCVSSVAEAYDATVMSRCKKYLPTVMKESRYLLGLNAPYWLFLSQIEKESRCDTTITSFDGGKGLGQFTGATIQWAHDEFSEYLTSISAVAAPYDPRWSIRAVILYDTYLYRALESICAGSVGSPDYYYAFRAYNGGAGNLKKEIAKAGTCKKTDLEKACKRKVLMLSSGPLDLCKVNISYPYKIEKGAEKWKSLQ